jgi:predicted homoserine dehydrogenase-like protein
LEADVFTVTVEKFMDPFNVGIIGLGGMGQMMLSDMLKHDRFVVSVVWDPNSNACKAVRTYHPDLHIAFDAGDLINDDANHAECSGRIRGSETHQNHTGMRKDLRT